MRLKHELRTWQKCAIARWQEHSQRGIVEVITGGGKTVLAEACMLHMLSLEPSIRFIIVVPTVALLDQWHVSLQEELGVATNDIAIFSGGRQRSAATFNLMVINTARRLVATMAQTGQFMLVVDECHRAGSEKNASALRGNFRATLGLSATPERQYDSALTEKLVPALGEVIFRYGLLRAREDGVVTPFRLVNIEVELLHDEKESYDKLSRRIALKLRGAHVDGQDLPDDVATLLRRRARVSSAATMRIPVAASLVDRHRGQRLMLFHEHIAAADRLYSVLRTRNHSATMYHTGVGSVMRRSNLRLYRQGVFDVMISCRALDEGINIPETEIAVIASATATIRQRIQRLGRVLRPAKGKTEATIYSLYATEPERLRLVDEAVALADTAQTTWLRAGVSHG